MTDEQIIALVQEHFTEGGIHDDGSCIEVISSEGEEFFWDVYDDCSNVNVSFHNDGKTLKVFLIKNK